MPDARRPADAVTRTHGDDLAARRNDGVLDPRRSTFDIDYWLRRCEGFVVETPGGRVGTVAGVRYGASAEPEVLEVRAGLLGRRRLLLPVADVAAIVPDERRVCLGARPTLLPTTRVS